ncbi:MAG: hypothetical protein K2O03_15825 [Lachnospiraceae bacterium]|nr:hypothetical protein [Lachnospiraceae bacterium]
MLVTGKIKALCLQYTLKKAETAKICVTGKNLVPGGVRYGYLKKGEQGVFSEGDAKYRMTDWFLVEESGKFLVMSGDAYNRAIWQFACADGKLLDAVKAEKKYRMASGKVSNLTFPSVRIPEGAVRARVFYAREKDAETLPLGERLQIEYGIVPTFYEKPRKEVYELPAIKSGRQLVYMGGKWYSAKQTGEEGFEPGALLRKWSTKECAIGAKIGCEDNVFLQVFDEKGEALEAADARMQVVYEPVRQKDCSAASRLMEDGGFGRKKDRGEKGNSAAASRNGEDGAKGQIPEYGVRIYQGDSVPVAERIGDAVGLHFNYSLNGEAATPYENDFDHIYPWSAMRRCALSCAEGGRRVLYEGEEGYRTDGRAGEVMVEIPKHYVKRRVVDGREEIRIAPKKKEGFVLDPAFLTPSGEVEAVYVGAYFAAEEFVEVASAGSRRMLDEPAPPEKTDDLMLVSRAGRQVSLFRSGEEFVAMAGRNHGFAELDLCTMLMLQRLFLVETALLDSQSVFGGNTYMPFLIWDRKATYYSSEDVPQTNSIRMRDNSISKRYRVGDAVAVMDTWSTYFTEKSGNMMRVITGREMDEDGMVRLTFSGAPIDLVANSTGMSELPEHTGRTDRLLGTVVSGEAFEARRAHDAFCYRGIENLWGGVWVVLGGCAVKDNRLRVDYPDGHSALVSYELPKQNVNLSSKQFGDPDRMYVKRMGYDPENPLIALPCEIGDGAGSCSYYCDAWFNEAEPGQEYIVTYGGAWDNMAYAGLFAFRASFTPEKRITFNGARLMCREGHIRNFKSEV